MKRIDGKVALVTGAASGIGMALAHELSTRGARLALLDRDEAALNRVCKQLDALALPCDVRDESAVGDAAETARLELGSIDLLFANAGVAAAGPIFDIPVEDARWLLEVNVLGSMIVARHVVPQMRDAGFGRVAFTASIAGLLGAPGLAAYTASKFAVVGYAESLRVELQRTGVTVTTICPGYVRTGLHKATRYHGERYSSVLDRAPEWVGLDAKRVARRGVDATLAGNPMVTLGVEKAAVWLRRLSIPAYTNVAGRAARAAGFFGSARGNAAETTAAT